MGHAQHYDRGTSRTSGLHEEIESVFVPVASHSGVILPNSFSPSNGVGFRDDPPYVWHDTWMLLSSMYGGIDAGERRRLG